MQTKSQRKDPASMTTEQKRRSHIVAAEVERAASVRILKFLRKSPESTIPQISVACEVTPITCSRYMKRMLERGEVLIVRRHKSAQFWSVSNAMRPNAPLSDDPVRRIVPAPACAGMRRDPLVLALFGTTGRGVPPPNNNTLRWCTGQIKIKPMELALEQRLAQLEGHILMITGVRQGESAIRDQRIEMSCSKDGAECGQGWYQKSLPEAKGLRGRLATLAPLLHWRVCHVWEWLRHWAPQAEFGDWSTATIADAYGGDEAEEVNARTGCIGCPLAQEDKALDTILLSPQWAYLAPLKGIKVLWRELREPQHRLRKAGLEILKSGKTAANPQRMGPLTFEARLMGLERILTIQSEINAVARATGRPEIDLINAEEEARIRELIDLETWPDGWDGDEPNAAIPLNEIVYQNGAVQPRLFSEAEL